MDTASGPVTTDQVAPPMKPTLTPGNAAASQQPRSQRRDALSATENPAWTARMLDRLAPAWNAVTDCRLFAGTIPGSLNVDEAVWRRVICEFFCIVEAFPKYMGLTLAKTTYGREPKDALARAWLIGNIKIEARHVEWYIDWANGHGLSTKELVDYQPSAAAGLDSWLWSVAYRGNLAEAVGAINYAIEGTTGEWTRRVLPAFTEYFNGEKSSLARLRNHAEYDDEHPIQALEIVNAMARGGEPAPAQVERVENSIRRSLELFRVAFDGCI